MQSQQKKVKWSRGETADALEERTDTGITQVSVSKLENIIADIYGNISRRPALKVIANATSAKNTTPICVSGTGQFTNPVDIPPSTFVFTVNQNKYIIFVVGYATITGFLIENEKYVRQVNITGEYITMAPNINAFGNLGHASFAQSNNWGVLSNVWRDPVVLRLTDTDDITVEKFEFTAPWYAPNGTQSKTVSASEVSGLQFNADGLGFTAFAWTDDGGISSPYSLIDTGVNGSTEQISKEIPVGSIVKFPNLGAYMRVEGYRLGGSTVYFSDYTFDAATVGTPVTTGLCVTVAWVSLAQWGGFFVVTAYDNGVRIDSVSNPTLPFWVQTTSGLKKLVTSGSSASWQDVSPAETDVQMFGPLLTPVAKGDAKDAIVTVETGYVSLNDYNPTEYVFSEQRLYATKWTSPDQESEIPGYVVGSQIARFNDFKNDYNTQTEAVVIDINTTYQEKVEFVADYNGLKIFTSDSEYAYSQQNGVPKQSTNGCSPNCRPVVFGATLLYADKSKRQIRALQYELQTDIYQSNVINQMCKEDLIYNPVAMASLYDKEHHTGSFLYVVQQTIIQGQRPFKKAAPSLAVCNFVPGNQAQIWGRWKVPAVKKLLASEQDVECVVNAITVNNKPWFVIAARAVGKNGGPVIGPGNLAQSYTLAELSHDNLLDFEIEADPTDTQYSLFKNTNAIYLQGWTYDAQTIYTEFNEVDLLSYVPDNSPVYNANGVQIGTVTTGTGTPGTSTYDPSIVYNGQRYNVSGNIVPVYDLTFPGATVSVFDGDQYMWDDTLDANGNYTKPLTDLTNPRVGFMVNAELISHPIDVGGKTYTDHKRIGKAVAVIRDTEPNAFTVCGRTGYTSQDKKTVNFYGCTGMKNQLRYTIKNIQGAKFTIESLTMIIEYGTLDS